MDIRPKAREELMRILSEAGAAGATITEVERRSKYERHTLSKYLSMMEAHGLITHKKIGKAKLWVINQAPLESVLNSVPESRTFTETVLSSVISSLPHGLAIINRDYTILFMNAPLWGRYGQKKGERFYEAVLGLEHPVKLRKLTALLEGASDSAELVIPDRKGRILRIRASPLRTPDNVRTAILLIEDITEWKRAQEEILEHRAMLEAERQALNESAILAETDLDGRITQVNDQFVNISGYGRHELIGKTHQVVNSGHHPREFFSKMWATIRKGKVWKGVIQNRAKDGSYYWVDSAIAPVMGKNGKPVKYLAIRFDITKYMKGNVKAGGKGMKGKGIKEEKGKTGKKGF